MTASFSAIDPRVFVSGQIDKDHLSGLVNQGVKVIVNHRPDREEPGQIASEDLEKEAAALGVRYVHAPVSGLPSPAAVQATGAALAALGPNDKALLFCKSGMRSSAAWAMAERDRGVDADTLRRQAAAAGYDLSRLPL